MYISLGVPNKVMADKNETIRLNAVGTTLIVPLAETSEKETQQSPKDMSTHPEEIL